MLAAFEEQVYNTMEEYKYIPQTLARTGKVQLAPLQLGRMIGHLFVIRHNVNMHSDILDTPDFFWVDNFYLPQYKLITEYLEIDSRVDVLNKRLDMTRELLELLQAQQENEHGASLEHIVIWLIAAEILLKLTSIFVDYLVIRD